MGKKNSKKTSNVGISETVTTESDVLQEIVGGVALLGLEHKKPEGKKLNKKEKALQANAVFAEHLGASGSRLEGWQELCRAVQKEPANSINKCKMILKNVHVVLYDLVEALQQQTVVPTNRLFRNHHVLANYLQNHRQEIYSKKFAKTCPFRKAMLRNVF